MESSDPAFALELGRAAEAPRAAAAYEPGSEADFERLYRNTYRQVLGTLITVLGDRTAAEDCAQDTFERAYRNWKSWRPEAPVEAWLHRIAVNVAISSRRRERLRQAGEVIKRLGRPPSAPDPAELAEQSEVLRALRSLPPKQSAALVLRHFYGYTNREIGLVIGAHEQTVASRLAAARKQLQITLAHFRSTKNG